MKFSQLKDETFKLNKIAINKSMAYLMPFESEENTAYERGINVNELFNIKTTGVVSGRDDVAIADSKEDLQKRIDKVRNAINYSEILEMWGKFGQTQTAEKTLNDVLEQKGAITPILYKPFDIRYTYYSGNSGGWMVRPRDKSTMGNMMRTTETSIGKNVGLVFGRRDTTSNFYAMVSVSNLLIDSIMLNSNTSGTASIAPLYIFDEITNLWEENLSEPVLTETPHA